MKRAATTGKEIPAEVERLCPQVYSMLPQITLPDLLLELDNWAAFLRPFTHLISGDAPVGNDSQHRHAPSRSISYQESKQSQFLPIPGESNRCL
ncbi:hypothetical protein [Ktedonobacter racemifer]|uniref:Transposase Tn3 family protein n=1 Tax=Ktedonobacter racemifer DSM 44963 TaxID=485913 RepID=D6TIP5_KTERA|nr:hypothetical protein [Ktedonobacter racemifer]EFH89302.1 transposase Tn3 family protein [Ktedonobacter racemifer DSM 44963]